MLSYIDRKLLAEFESLFNSVASKCIRLLVVTVPVTLFTTYGFIAICFDNCASFYDVSPVFGASSLLLTFILIILTALYVRRFMKAYELLSSVKTPASNNQVESLNFSAYLHPEVVEANPELKEILRKQKISVYEYRYIAQPLFAKSCKKRLHVAPDNSLINKISGESGEVVIDQGGHQNILDESPEKGFLNRISSAGAKPGGKSFKE